MKMLDKQRKQVQDEFGGTYDIKEKLAQGGQGTVWRTRVDNLLVKLCHWPDSDARTQRWRQQIEAIQRMPIVEAQLPIVMPKARIVSPNPGYVMELVDGLIPLEQLIEQAALPESFGLQGFVASGGLARRSRLLARLARVLAKLHGLSIAHGDISPKNIFVSRSQDHGEVWLIDSDNLSYAVKDSSLPVYTPDYGAPEIFRGDSGISTYTDSWSFAVIAFQLMTLLHPFKSGELVDSDVELEVAAHRGELPWIDHCDDERNRSGLGIPREYVLTPTLVALFDRCFRLGLEDHEQRPSMAEWAGALEAASALQVECVKPKGCGSTFYWNKQLQCPFCDCQHNFRSALLLHNGVYTPLDQLGEEATPKDSWIATGYVAVVGQRLLELRSSPRALLCTLIARSWPPFA